MNVAATLLVEKDLSSSHLFPPRLYINGVDREQSQNMKQRKSINEREPLQHTHRLLHSHIRCTGCSHIISLCVRL